MSTLKRENLSTTLGKTQENVEVGSQHEGSSETNWETQAKYFQSEKDKLYAENQKLKQYEQLGQVLESRPDVVENMTQMLKGEPNQEQIEVSRDEFDSWEAYNDPQSPSYKLRMQQEAKIIDEKVNQRLSKIEQKAGIDSLESQLRNRGLNDEQVKSFFEFANQSPANHGIDGAIKMWQAVTNVETRENPLDAIRNNQNLPQSGGVLQGQSPSTKSESDSAWEAIVGASDKNVF
tara:strand:+ start:102 stop:803 length:702 start_codon:yes stop_codon:yes gene_type:complete